ncbi:hypothetical protein F9C07_11243 [Aspergillus flavus]|uniref:Uncharacterized protein n=1 Tax=Aspergillus flavus (strain ATCC 200026 / FGSC A1120 / IAM 13836 / NRRL 3357 / JCM 12722 / SRRC 167) TaxID=332952 RepID=A0A7U2MSM0_ASPFN|nr:hypothetical protein F9C07_11243 [Aspergillus flavus]
MAGWLFCTNVRRQGRALLIFFSGFFDPDVRPRANYKGTGCMYLRAHQDGDGTEE